jgi:hypothetical protein
MSGVWRIEWWGDSLEELTNLLAGSGDRVAMTQAVSIAQQMLSSSPQQQGISIAEGLRRLDVSPLAFYFEVERAAQLVKLVNVKRLR